MKIFYSQKFNKVLISLPTGIKRIYKKQEDLFIINWKDPRLHAKKIIGTVLLSFRITRKYRVLFKFADENSASFLSIGHRKDIYD